MVWRLVYINIIYGRVIFFGGIFLVNYIIRENFFFFFGVYGREIIDRSFFCFIYVVLRVCYICNRFIFYISFMSISKSVKIC